MGCFHTLVSLLGAIGTLMEGTGLKNIIETVYGECAVGHMMTGKAVQRALRGHLLVDKCLHSQLIAEVATLSVGAIRSLKSIGWSNAWQWDDRRHEKPLDSIGACYIRVQLCDARFYRPELY